MAEIIPPQAIRSYEETIDGNVVIKHEYADKSYGIEDPKAGTLAIYHDDGSWDAYKLKEGSKNNYVLTTKHTKDGECYEIDENGEIISYSTKLPTPISIETEMIDNRIVAKQNYPDGSYGIEDEYHTIHRYYPDGKEERYEYVSEDLYRRTITVSDHGIISYDDKGRVRGQLEGNHFHRDEYYIFDKNGYVDRYEPWRISDKKESKEDLGRRTFYSNGQVAEEIEDTKNAKGEIKTRTSRNYYPNGQIKSVEKDGKTLQKQEYYPDAQLKKEYTTIESGNRQGYKERTYYPNGQIKTEEKHIKNTFRGVSVDKKRSYYENGQVESESKDVKTHWGANETHKFEAYNPDGTSKTKPKRETAKEKIARLRQERAERQARREELKSMRAARKNQNGNSALSEYQEQQEQDKREGFSLFAMWRNRKLQNA